MDEPTTDELLEQVRALKQELSHVKKQLRKKSHQASVYNKMMHGAMRRLPDEWFPFKASIEAETEPMHDNNLPSEKEKKFAVRESWNSLQKKISVHIKPR